VLDLEDLARHRSSVLGALPGIAQPTQKRFDTLVWEQLRQFDPERVVFVESESKKVGNVSIHPALVERMRSSPCSVVDLSLEQRVELLLEDYAYFTAHPEQFCARLDALTAQRGKVVIEEWKALVRQGDLRPVVQDLLVSHYDPVYLQSMERNFVQFAHASTLVPADRSVASMQALADSMTSA
jgi:tRNA 2-selenouridine synthase